MIIYLKVGKSMAGSTLKTKQALQSYINENGRINNKLYLIVELLRNEQQPLVQLKSVAIKITDPIKLFRCLILLHTWQINLKLYDTATITILSTLCSQSKPNPKIRLEMVIHSQVLQQYALYIQKRCQFVAQMTQHEDDTTPQQKLFRAINLFKCGLAFVDILYTFGRYYKQKYSFVTDFNMLLGQDFQMLYERRIKAPLKANRHLYTNDMKQEIEKLHEGLYLVYYNCYYYKQLHGFVPKFIDTEPSSMGRASSMQKRNSRMNQSEVFNLRTRNQSCNKMNQSYVWGGSTQSHLALSMMLGTDKNVHDPQQQINKSIMNTTAWNLNSSKMLTNKSRIGKSANEMSMLSVTESYTHMGDEGKRDELVMQEVSSQVSEEDENYKVLESLERVVAEIENRTLQNNSKCSNLTATP